MRGGWQAAVTIVTLATALSRAAADILPVRDEDGNTLAVVVVCSECQSPTTAKTCAGGTEHGWLDGKPCGQCLLQQNAVATMTYPYDLHFTGTLVDATGAPLKNRFVKLFMANGWSVKTRTSESGTFRLMLGATLTRKSKTPLVTDLGKRLDTRPADDAQYALFFLPAHFTPCPPGADKPPAKTPAGKKTKSRKS